MVKAFVRRPAEIWEKAPSSQTANLTETGQMGILLSWSRTENIAADTITAGQVFSHSAEKDGLKDLYVDGGYDGKRCLRKRLLTEFTLQVILLHFGDATFTSQSKRRAQKDVFAAYRSGGL